MASKHFVHQSGQQKGPWTFDEILKEIEASRLQWTDYLFDEQKKDWVLLLDYGPLSERFQFWSNQKATSTLLPDGALDEEWFVLKGENKYGPFAFLDMVKMLQDKKLFEFDYIWTKKLAAWSRVADCADFQPEKIKALRDAGKAKAPEVFFRRRHARAMYRASILLHNNTEVWKGRSLEVSPGGAALIIPSVAIKVGDSLFLHFKAGDGVPPFNATCTIVSKKELRGNEVRYGVKFTSIAQSIQAAIKKYTDRAA